MKIHKTVILFFSIIAFVFSVNAQSTLKVGFLNLGADDGIDVDLSAIYASYGYTFQVSDDLPFTITPEIRYGTGVSDDSVDDLGYTAKVEVDRLLSLSVRFQFDMDSIYLFGSPAYTNIKSTATVSGASGAGNLQLHSVHHSESVSDDEWEMGANVGLGFNISESFGIEVMYEKYDSADAYGAAVSYRF